MSKRLRKVFPRFDVTNKRVSQSKISVAVQRKIRESSTPYMSRSTVPLADQPAKDNCIHPYCPLSRVRTGAAVRVKQLSTAPEVAQRLREMGLREEQTITLVHRQTNLICGICNTRLGLSARLADAIMVEPLAA